MLNHQIFKVQELGHISDSLQAWPKLLRWLIKKGAAASVLAHFNSDKWNVKLAKFCQDGAQS